ncbi:MAG: methyltransferase dimerization domain-containing protein [Caldilineaceae bacterium]
MGDEQYSAAQLGERLGLHPRGTYDFFDALVALKFLDREGDGPHGRYKNTPQTAAFLNKQSPTYIGGLPEMFNARLFGFWNAFGLLMSLNMLIEFGDAFDYTGADFRAWCREAGFTRFDLIALAGPSSAAIAYKEGDNV